MDHNQTPSCVILTDMSRNEKLKIWFTRSDWTLVKLAEQTGFSSSYLSRSLRQESIPADLHKALAAAIPTELLPRPENKKPGKSRKTFRLPTPDYLEMLKQRPLLRAAEVESLYGVSSGTLANLRSRGNGPQYSQVQKGTGVFYTHEAIKRYLGLPA